MTTTSYIFGIASALLVLWVVIELLRRRRLRERHAIWWLIAGTLALVIGVFPDTLRWASDLVGIEVPTNLVFFVSIGLLFLVALQHSGELTRLEAKTRTLAEQTALQELRIRTLEDSAPSAGSRDRAPAADQVDRVHDQPRDRSDQKRYNRLGDQVDR